MKEILDAILGIGEIVSTLARLIKAFVALLTDFEQGSAVNTTQLGDDAKGAAEAAVELVHTFQGQVALVEHVLHENHPNLPEDVRHTVAAQAVTVERHKADASVKAVAS